MTAPIFIADGHTGADIGPDGAEAFHRDGLLRIKGLLRDDELSALREETSALIADTTGKALPDYRYKIHKLTGEPVPFRIDYVIDKSVACQRLLGHPYIVGSMKRLLGENILPTWDSMVFKQSGKGAKIPWHRDQRRGSITDDQPLAINVDFYLDPADSSNGLRGIPGSQKWTDEKAQGFIDELGDDEFSDEVAMPLAMRAGDVLLHDAFVLHGSPESTSDLRRVLYYEFRNAEGEAAYGPHTDDYIVQKQAALSYCTNLRLMSDEGRPSCRLRVPHDQYWRSDSVFVAGQLTN